MGLQKKSGKAFECAVVEAVRTVVGSGNVVVVDSPAVSDASGDFYSLPEERQEQNLAAAVPAVGMLLKFEPHLVVASQGRGDIRVSMQSDQKGGLGDVRDILLASPDDDWEIGISAKHQHEALKHSRLSQRIDFGEKWLGVRCSSEYFAAIAPVFAYLSELKSQGAKWSEVPNKGDDVYVPILQAFRNEVLSLDRRHPGVVGRGLVSYLIGTQDFYKLVKLKQQAKIQVFNFNGTLNNPAPGMQPDMRLDRLKLPTRVVELEFKRDRSGMSPTTLDMICDAGWQISFRIHSASTLVETSLKFDINLVGRPNELQTFSVVWET